MKIVSTDHRGIVQRWRSIPIPPHAARVPRPQGRPKPKKGTDISLEMRELDGRAMSSGAFRQPAWGPPHQ